MYGPNCIAETHRLPGPQFANTTNHRLKRRTVDNGAKYPTLADNCQSG